MSAIIGQKAPNFEVSDWVQGGPVNFDQLSGRVVLVDIFTIALSLCTLFLVFRFKVNSAWLVLGGGLLGVIYKLVVS